MKKFLTVMFFTGFTLFPFFAHADSQNPSCVLMKFTDDTRYDAIDSAGVLSDLVMEKLVTSKKFNLKEFEPLSENIEARLYDEKVDDFTRFNAAINSGDYNEFFEGDGFKESKAQSVSTAQVGQIVTPEITSEIGNNHNAEYLIQGNIINLGTGNWMNEDLATISEVVSSVAKAAGSLGFLGELGSINITLQGIGVQCDVRIIKASTGEVVWSKRVLGIGESNLISIGPVTFGHSNLSSSLYTKAMNTAADKIVSALIEDMEKNSLFLK